MVSLRALLDEMVKLQASDLHITAGVPKKKTSKKEPVFSREPIDCDWLKKVDLDIAIEVESFAQESLLANSGQFHVGLQSGLLSISPAGLVYPKGKLDMDLQVDARDHPAAGEGMAVFQIFGGFSRQFSLKNAGSGLFQDLEGFRSLGVPGGLYLFGQLINGVEFHSSNVSYSGTVK